MTDDESGESIIEEVPSVIGTGELEILKKHTLIMR